MFRKVLLYPLDRSQHIIKKLRYFARLQITRQFGYQQCPITERLELILRSGETSTQDFEEAANETVEIDENLVSLGPLGEPSNVGKDHERSHVHSHEALFWNMETPKPAPGITMLAQVDDSAHAPVIVRICVESPAIVLPGQLALVLTPM
jgi:hypothetical protein